MLGAPGPEYPVYIIPVHGTFASDAAWVEPSSPLCKALQKAVEDGGWKAIFPPAPFVWTGSNKMADRQKAACRLAHEIRDCARRTPGAPIVLIGHSHGGSVISYCLNQFPDVQTLVTNCVFMSTPFYSIRVATWIEAFARTLQIMLAILASVGSIALLAWLNVTSHLVDVLNNINYKYNSVIYPARFLSTVAIAAAAFWLVASRDHKSQSDKLRTWAECGMKGQATASIPAGLRTFFIRMTGDEAAGVLVAIQVAVYVNVRIEAMLGVVLRWIRDFVENKRGSRPYKIALAILFAGIVFWLLEVLTFGFNDEWHWPQYFIENTRIYFGPNIVFKSAWYHDFFDIPVRYAIYAVFAVAILFVVLLTAFLGIAVVTRLMLSIAAKLSFGIGGFAAPVLCEIAVEPLPSGQHFFNHIDWSHSGVPNHDLLHSQVYIVPEAIDAIKRWVAADYSGGPHAVPHPANMSETHNPASPPEK